MVEVKNKLEQESKPIRLFDLWLMNLKPLTVNVTLTLKVEIQVYRVERWEVRDTMNYLWFMFRGNVFISCILLLTFIFRLTYFTSDSG